MDDARPEIITKLILDNIHLLRNRDWLLEIYTEADRLTVNPIAETGDYIDTDNRTAQLTTECPMYVGKIFTDADGSLLQVENITDEKPFTVRRRVEATDSDQKRFKINLNNSLLLGRGVQVYTVTWKPTGITTSDFPDRLVTPQTPIRLPPKAIANAPNEPLDTTVGILTFNYLLHADPFGETFEYVNGIWTTSALENRLIDATLKEKIVGSQLDRYVRNLFFIGHMTEICVPSYSPKSLTTDPRLEERKKELLEIHKDALARGDVTVMTQIEAELIQMDKDWIKGDVSEGFYIEDKNFEIHRKSLFVTNGIKEGFGATKNFVFVSNSLAEGWTYENFATIANESRRGSFLRAKETARGGEDSKFLMRVFQNTRIVMEDCGSTRGVPITISGALPSRLLYRYIVDPSTGSLTLLSDDVMPTYKDKTVILRSPQECDAEGGFCFRCMGKRFEVLDQQSLTLMFVDIGSFFLQSSMKAMHAVTYKTYNLNDLNKFVL